MFHSIKCFAIYFIILLYVATGAIGMNFDGDWLKKDDPKTIKANTFLNKACQKVLDKAIEDLNKEIKIELPVTAVSMVYLEQGKDKAKHTGVVALQDSYDPNSGQRPGVNQEADEGNFFTIVFNYLNLEGDDINDEDRMLAASDTIQDYAVTTSLKLAQDGVKALIGNTENIKMARPILRGVKKTWKKCSRAIVNLATGKSAEASGSTN